METGVRSSAKATPAPLGVTPSSCSSEFTSLPLGCTHSSLENKLSAVCKMALCALSTSSHSVLRHTVLM